MVIATFSNQQIFVVSFLVRFVASVVPYLRRLRVYWGQLAEHLLLSLVELMVAVAALLVKKFIQVESTQLIGVFCLLVIDLGPVLTVQLRVVKCLSELLVEASGVPLLFLDLLFESQIFLCEALHDYSKSCV